MHLQVAYLVNQYPAVSHTFIRREIHALERRGITVQRIALRGWDTELVDESDRRERERTRYVLRRGALRLAAGLLSTALRSPRRLLKAVRLMQRIAKGSDRPLHTHVIYLAEACVIQRWLAQLGVAHLHAHFATNPAEVAMLVRELGGPPYSFTAHGSDITDRPAQMGLELKVARAAFVAAVCSFGRSQLFKWVTHGSWDRVRVVRCGLEPGYGAASLSHASPGRLLCVGRLSKEKGQLLLIEAARELAATGEAPDIVLAGDGPMRGEIESLVARYGLDGKVRITGWLDARGVEAELRQARALVVPSLSEGLPVVIMEAMAHRRAVIAPYLAGIPELVQHGTTGWLFAASDTSGLAEAIRSCMASDPAALQAMGDAAHARVWTLHHVDVEAERLATLFHLSAAHEARLASP